MKDKLYKTGHKRAYYRFRFAARTTLIALALGLSASAPILITYGVEQSRAEAAKEKENVSEVTSDVTSSEQTLSYGDALI